MSPEPKPGTVEHHVLEIITRFQRITFESLAIAVHRSVPVPPKVKESVRGALERLVERGAVGSCPVIYYRIKNENPPGD